MYPRLLINLKKYENNVKIIKDRLAKLGIYMFGVSKVYCSDLRLAEILYRQKVDAIADSRIENLKKIQHFNMEKVLLRLPMHSEIEDVIRYSDISLNSEISTLELLSDEAIKHGTIHGVILMIDLGDLREGFFDENELIKAAEKAILLDGIKLVGIGTNLTCFGAVIPKRNHMNKLVELKNKIESKFSVKLEYISAGNSSSYYLTEENNLPKGINNLRIGELLAVGRETAFGQRVEGTYNDVFVLEAEIIELKTKPSVPIGEAGVDAFGNKPAYEDKGEMRRAICAIGRQDITIDAITPFDDKINVIGSSSDHIILDVTASEKKYVVGDVVKFNLKYGGVLAAMTSKYVKKEYIND